MPPTSMSPDSLPTTYDQLVRLYMPCAVHDAVSYQNLMEVIDAMTCVVELTEAQHRYLETLSILAEAYENRIESWDAGDVSPREVVATLVESHGMTASQLGELLGDRSLGSRVLNGKRELSKAHIRTLARHFNVSPAAFL